MTYFNPSCIENFDVYRAVSLDSEIADFIKSGLQGTFPDYQLILVDSLPTSTHAIFRCGKGGKSPLLHLSTP